MLHSYIGDPTKAAGGNIVAHSSTYRIYPRNLSSQEEKRSDRPPAINNMKKNIFYHCHYLPKVCV
jgi:hypothetical protein